jgi:hypothetical protein
MVGLSQQPLGQHSRVGQQRLTQDPLGECECYSWVLIDPVSFLSMVLGL